MKHIIHHIDLFFYHNWQVFTISQQAINFVYLCMLAFIAGFIYGLLK